MLDRCTWIQLRSQNSCTNPSTKNSCSHSHLRTPLEWMKQHHHHTRPHQQTSFMYLSLVCNLLANSGVVCVLISRVKRTFIRFPTRRATSSDISRTRPSSSRIAVHCYEMVRVRTNFHHFKFDTCERCLSTLSERDYFCWHMFCRKGVLDRRFDRI